jgi:hypothetical protein
VSDERIDVWERMFDAAETKEERDQLWELAKTSKELDVARAGLARTTNAKGERPCGGC